ncbi:MAG: metal-sulfur cluster assembly factor [Anaerolineales bacterium]|nr:metal-sulfur cluster assembly factor [Anaerolineales bacterium]
MGTEKTSPVTGDTTHLWEALHDVEDPEFPMSVVDMGLIVDIAQEAQVVKVKMTFTAMGCPCIDVIMEDTRARLLQEPGVDEVEIEVVWSPVWTKHRLTERGKEIMHIYGVAV